MSERKIWQFADYTVADIRAVQAFFSYCQLAEREFPPGEEPVFTPSDAKRLRDWLLNDLCRMGDNGTMAALACGDTTGTVAPLIDGARSVGKQLINAAQLRPAAIEKLLEREREAKAARSGQKD